MEEATTMSIESKNELTDLEKEELRSRFSSMRPEELDFVMSFIPPELCVARLSQVISRFSRVNELLDIAKTELFEGLIK